MIFCPMKYTQNLLCPTFADILDTKGTCVSLVGHKPMKLHNHLQYKGL
jgi:hypothetical protein